MITSPLADSGMFLQLSYWHLTYIMSDLSMLVIVFISYFFMKRRLYSYARFKFVLTTCILLINYSLLGYGGYIISELPTNFKNDPDLSE